MQSAPQKPLLIVLEMRLTTANKILPTVSCVTPPPPPRQAVFTFHLCFVCACVGMLCVNCHLLSSPSLLSTAKRPPAWHHSCRALCLLRLRFLLISSSPFANPFLGGFKNKTKKKSLLPFGLQHTHTHTHDRSDSWGRGERAKSPQMVCCFLLFCFFG